MQSKCGSPKPDKHGKHIYFRGYFAQDRKFNVGLFSQASYLNHLVKQIYQIFAAICFYVLCILAAFETELRAKENPYSTSQKKTRCMTLQIVTVVSNREVNEPCR